MCDINRRKVTFCSFVNSLSGTFHRFSFTFTSSSMDNLPCSTRYNAPVAATGLLIDPAWKSVFVVTGAFEPAPIIPYPFAQAILKSSITAMLSAGTLYNSIS